jgi:Fe-S oxidoreductase
LLAREQRNSRLDDKAFKPPEQSVAVHVHRHQQALSDPQTVLDTLQLIPKCHAQLIRSGCCGMAGSFGYECNHYELSVQIGELVLFPTLRALTSETRVVATGTSYRQQVWQGTGLAALHTAEILYELLALFVPK